MRGYGEGYDNAMGTGPQPTAMRMPDAAANKHACNNGHGRHSGDAERRKKGPRGFNSDEPGLFVLDEVYHNFLRPRTGLGGLTPAEKAGVIMQGPDNILTMIRRAAASRIGPA